MSWLTKIALRNRSIVGLAVLAVLLFGAFAITGLKQELIPDLAFPYLTVFTVAPGSSPKDVERTITTPLEQAVKATSDVKAFDSFSNDGVSIITIYEGTTAIQANDLVGRKTARDAGQTAKGLAAQIASTEAELTASATPDALAMAKRLAAARLAFVEVVDFVVGNTKVQPNAVFSGSVPYLMLAGNLMAGWQMGRALLVAQEALARGEDVAFMQAKISTARFYADHILTQVPGLRDSIVEGAASVTALALDAF